MTPRGGEVTVRNKRPLCSGQGRPKAKTKARGRGRVREGGAHTQLLPGRETTAGRSGTAWLSKTSLWEQHAGKCSPEGKGRRGAGGGALNSDSDSSEGHSLREATHGEAQPPVPPENTSPGRLRPGKRQTEQAAYISPARTGLLPAAASGSQARPHHWPRPRPRVLWGGREQHSFWEGRWAGVSS